VRRITSQKREQHLLNDPQLIPLSRLSVRRTIGLLH
jgi:hypothetical protein